VAIAHDLRFYIGELFFVNPLFELVNDDLRTTAVEETAFLLSFLRNSVVVSCSLFLSLFSGTVQAQKRSAEFLLSIGIMVNAEDLSLICILRVSSEK
jgi:hypothetical protein